MKISALTAVLATLVLLISCGKKDEPPPVVQQATQSSAPAEPILSPSELEKQTLDECTPNPINTERPSIEALEALQDQMRCIEDFLDRNKNTKHWQQAYEKRFKAMTTSMLVINALNEPSSRSSETDMANAQRLLMDIEKLKKLKIENYYFAKRAIDEITISLHHALFRELKDGGMQMGNPQEKLNDSNRSARNSGVWESSIDETREGGQFVVTRWVTEKSPMFVIEGYGTTSIIIKIEDRFFDDNGAFSAKCKVYLGVTQTRLSYDCVEYLSGKQGRQVIDDMKSLIKEDMTKKAGSNIDSAR